MKKRWRKRLEDLGQLLSQAESSYFDPNLFRLNINNAIQTARTVTFLIQKEKESIPEFESWYKKHVIDATANDKIMSWLKDARNTIEKEGDLDVHSFWQVSHLFSYTDDGEKLITEDKKSLFSNIGSLKKIAKSRVPPGIFEDSALVIDRCWIANTLPGLELIDAVTYGYRKLSKIVDLLDSHLGIPHQPLVEDENFLYISQTRRAYLKLSDSSIYKLRAAQNPINRGGVTPDEVKSLIKESDVAFYEEGASMAARVESLADIAKKLMSRDGGHITVCFLFGSKKTDFKIIHPDFQDKVDKLIFFHEIAYMIGLSSITSMFFVAEAWLRDPTRFGLARMSDLKIIGEALEITGISKSGDTSSLQFKIEREGELIKLEKFNEMSVHEINYLAPLRRAWNLNGMVREASK